MKRITAGVSALALLATVIATQVNADAVGGDDAALTGAEIFSQVDVRSVARASHVASYASTRKYAVFEPHHDVEAELVASMRFVAPSTKTFTTTSEKGVGWIHKRVFRRLMDAEREAAALATERTGSAIAPANYTAQRVPDDVYRGRACYVLALTPRRADKYLMRGKVWIDKEDLAIARVDGEPLKSPSIWVVRAPFVREYQRIDELWLPLRDETHTQIRFAGEYVLRIDYSDYSITRRDDVVEGRGPVGMATGDEPTRLVSSKGTETRP